MFCIGMDEENNTKFEEKALNYGMLYSHFESDLMLLMEEQARKRTGILELLTNHFGYWLSDYLDGMMQHLNQPLSTKSFYIVLGGFSFSGALKC